MRAESAVGRYFAARSGSISAIGARVAARKGLGPPVRGWRGGGPLDDFRARTLQLAKALPVRWGNAGLAYAGWELTWYPEVRHGIFAHARRYPGFDMGQYASLMNELHHAMRTVSWINVVGPALLSDLEQQGGALIPTGALSVVRDGELVVVQAGDAPASGDTNRLDLPEAYAEADAVLRRIRLKPPQSFHGAWDERATEAWLTRFERQRT